MYDPVTSPSNCNTTCGAPGDYSFGFDSTLIMACRFTIGGQVGEAQTTLAGISYRGIECVLVSRNSMVEVDSWHVMVYLQSDLLLFCYFDLFPTHFSLHSLIVVHPRPCLLFPVHMHNY